MRKKLTAKDIMTTQVKTLAPGATLRDVAAFLTQHDISGAPIVDLKGCVQGVISESDLIQEARRHDAIPRLVMFGMYALPEPEMIEAFRDGWMLPASDLMSRKLISATDDTTLQELSRLMVQKRINSVPIVRDGTLVGIVTRDDVLRGMSSPGGEKPKQGSSQETEIKVG